MTPSIEIVVHCWSGDDVPIYHKLLQAQLSSLVLFDQETDITYSLMLNDGDKRTLSVVDYFMPRLKECEIQFEVCNRPKNVLFKRMLGRNERALKTKSDWIWFADVDYLFTHSCIDEVVREANKTEANLVYPNEMSQNKNHALGDEYIESLNSIEVGLPNFDDFAPMKTAYAFGGIQIARGDWCRKNGYLNHRKDWLKPLETAEHFNNTPSDIRFRNKCQPSKRIDVDGVYRIRHSRVGRDKGKVDHSQ